MKLYRYFGPKAEFAFDDLPTAAQVQEEISRQLAELKAEGDAWEAAATPEQREARDEYTAMVRDLSSRWVASCRYPTLNTYGFFDYAEALSQIPRPDLTLTGEKKR